MAAAKLPTLVFDYDGTIHQTMAVYKAAILQNLSWLKETHHIEIPPVDDATISSWLGINVKDMWSSFLPQLDPKLTKEISGRVGKDMENLIRKGQGLWYDGIPSLLDLLKTEGYDMIIVSNCQSSYRDANWSAFSMDRWFQTFYDCQSFDYQPKSAIINSIRQKQPGSYIMIGDRFSDMEGARGSCIPFIGCLYGYGREGELDRADLLVSKPAELLSAIHHLA